MCSCDFFSSLNKETKLESYSDWLPSWRERISQLLQQLSVSEEVLSKLIWDVEELIYLLTHRVYNEALFPTTAELFLQSCDPQRLLAIYSNLLVQFRRQNPQKFVLALFSMVHVLSRLLMIR